MKLYSKNTLTVPLSAMSKTGRFVHSYIITGEKGTGKKTAAKYIAMMLMCDNGNACGECRQCRRILKNQHPDFITVEHEKKYYSVDDVRKKVVEDSYTSPNDCDRKVYLLSDCEGWRDSAQNALLKITEDPPESSYFIFTAPGRSFFLPTLISRSMVIDIPEADREDCLAALADMGYEAEKSAQAVASFGGNIGRCIEYLEGADKLMEAACAVRKAADAVYRRDEYALAAVLSGMSSDRDELRIMLDMLGRAIRDGIAVRHGKPAIGCAAEESTRLSQRLTDDRLLEMYDAVCEISDSCTRNCNAAAAAAVLAGRLC